MKTSTFFIAAVLALLLVQLVFSTTPVAKVEELVYSDKPFLELVTKYTVDGGERVDY